MYASNLMVKRKLSKVLEDEKKELIDKLFAINVDIYVKYAKLTGSNVYLDIFKIMDYNDDSFESIRIKLHERSDILKRIREIEPCEDKILNIQHVFSLQFA
jgi:hypothetical protein